MTPRKAEVEGDLLDVGGSEHTARIWRVELAGWETRDAGRHWFYAAKHRSHLWRWTQTYNEELYLAAVERSRLKAKVKKSMVATAETAAPQGVTKVSRQVIADEVGCRRVATVTAHWQAAEAEGLMTSKPRYNNSNVIQLTLPPGDYSNIEDDVSRLPVPHEGPHDPPF